MIKCGACGGAGARVWGWKDIERTGTCMMCQGEGKVDTAIIKRLLEDVAPASKKKKIRGR